MTTKPPYEHGQIAKMGQIFILSLWKMPWQFCVHSIRKYFKNYLHNYKGQNIYKVLLEKHMLIYTTGATEENKEKTIKLEKVKYL